MDPDIQLTLGLLFVFLAIPAAVSAYSDRRPPRAAAFTVLIAGGMILFACFTKPGGYRLAGLPDVVLGVIAWVLN